MKSIKTIVLLALFILNEQTFAQYTFAKIGVDGLTCSACSRSVEMGLLKLSFVDSVIMNLENTDGKIVFKKGSKVDVEKISKAVTDAGFSLRFLNATISIDELNVTKDYCWIYDNSAYHFIKITEDKKVNGVITVKFVGEKYMSKKDYKEWKTYCTNGCVLPSNLVLPTSRRYYVYLL